MMGWLQGVENSGSNLEANIDAAVNQVPVDIAFTFMEFGGWLDMDRLRAHMRGFFDRLLQHFPLSHYFVLYRQGLDKYFSWPTHDLADRFQRDWENYETNGVPLKDSFTIRTRVPMSDNVFEPSGNHVRYLCLQIIRLEKDATNDDHIVIRSRLTYWGQKVAPRIPYQECKTLGDTRGGECDIFVLLGPWNNIPDDRAWTLGSVTPRRFIPEKEGIDTPRVVMGGFDVMKESLPIPY
ncbi:hypothetical protein FQN55_000167 [Onygenales sp. PD_40]|nr:hypothetical protein FQN55_000167 [Onygenales sp. PD_40]